MLGSSSIPPLSCETLTGDTQVGDVQLAGFGAGAPQGAVDRVLGGFWVQVDWCLNRHPQGRVEKATSVSLSFSFSAFSVPPLFPSPFVLIPTLPSVSSRRLPVRSPFPHSPPPPSTFLFSVPNSSWQEATSW